MFLKGLSPIVAMAAAIAASTAKLGWFAGRHGTPPRPKRRRPPVSGTSWRQLCRAVARGDIRPRPATIEAALRHKWFQKAAYSAALRCQNGVGTAGDGALVETLKNLLAKSRINTLHAKQNMQGAPS